MKSSFSLPSFILILPFLILVVVVVAVPLKEKVEGKYRSFHGPKGCGKNAGPGQSRSYTVHVHEL